MSICQPGKVSQRIMGGSGGGERVGGDRVVQHNPSMTFMKQLTFEIKCSLGSLVTIYKSLELLKKNLSLKLLA